MKTKTVYINTLKLPEISSLAQEMSRVADCAASSVPKYWTINMPAVLLILQKKKLIITQGTVLFASVNHCNSFSILKTFTSRVTVVVPVKYIQHVIYWVIFKPRQRGFKF